MGVARYTAEPVGVLRSDNGAVGDAAPAAWLPTGETVDLHVVLYGLILGLPISGLLLTLTRGDTMELFG